MMYLITCILYDIRSKKLLHQRNNWKFKHAPGKCQGSSFTTICDYLPFFRFPIHAAMEKDPFCSERKHLLTDSMSKVGRVHSSIQKTTQKRISRHFWETSLTHIVYLQLQSENAKLPLSPMKMKWALVVAPRPTPFNKIITEQSETFQWHTDSLNIKIKHHLTLKTQKFIITSFHLWVTQVSFSHLPPIFQSSPFFIQRKQKLSSSTQTPKNSSKSSLWTETPQDVRWRIAQRLLSSSQPSPASPVQAQRALVRWLSTILALEIPRNFSWQLQKLGWKKVGSKWMFSCYWESTHFELLRKHPFWVSSLSVSWLLFLARKQTLKW